MVEKPEIHCDVYPAIDFAKFKGKLKGRVAVVTGIYLERMELTKVPGEELDRLSRPVWPKRGQMSPSSI